MIKDRKIIEGYHFTGDTLRDGRPIPPIGEWLRYEGNIVPCKSGLHCSEHPYDALMYAPGNMLHKVKLRGDLHPHNKPIDKWVGSERLIIASIDATDMLRKYARWCALQVIHLWEAPQVVRDYLETGDKPLGNVAEAAAMVAARAAEWAAEWAAAGAAARAAAEWAVAGWAAREAVEWAVWAETGAAARAAADAAGAAARAKQRDKFAELVNGLI